MFVYDASGKLVAEYSTNVVPVQDAKVQYLTNDNLGTPRINTDATGNVASRTDYMPFGEEIMGLGGRTAADHYTTDDVRQGFTGYINDEETGLDFAQARMFSNKLGRFTTVDPLRANAPLRDSQMFNRYSYVRNSPTGFIDSLGLSPERPWPVLDGGECARRKGRCIKGALVPMVVELYGELGRESGATILVPSGMMAHLERDASLIHDLWRSLGKQFVEAIHAVDAVRNMANSAFPNPISPLGDRLTYTRLPDQTYIVGPDMTMEMNFGWLGLGGSASMTYSLRGIFDAYNASVRNANEQYRTLRSAFVAAWSDTVVPVQQSSLGYTTGALTREFLQTLWESRMQEAIWAGVREGNSEAIDSPAPVWGR